MSGKWRCSSQRRACDSEVVRVARSPRVWDRLHCSGPAAYGGPWASAPAQVLHSSNTVTYFRFAEYVTPAFCSDVLARGGFATRAFDSGGVAPPRRVCPLFFHGARCRFARRAPTCLVEAFRGPPALRAGLWTCVGALPAPQVQPQTLCRAPRSLVHTSAYFSNGVLSQALVVRYGTRIVELRNLPRTSRHLNPFSRPRARRSFMSSGLWGKFTAFESPKPGRSWQAVSTP
jgi:hypothetical protein